MQLSFLLLLSSAKALSEQFARLSDNDLRPLRASASRERRSPYAAGRMFGCETPNSGIAQPARR
jgi:hypothetical protein